jgi:hypothetical protein
MHLIVPYSGKSGGGDDEELRFTLRSVYENYSGLERLFVVGVCPSWLRLGNGVQLYVREDRDPRNKDVNIINKILDVVRGNEGEYLVNSDDQLFCRPVSDTDLRKVWLAPPSVLREAALLAAGPKVKSVWHSRLLATLRECRLQGWPELVFEVHLPYVVDAEAYCKVMDALEGDYEDGLLTHIYFNAYLPKAGCRIPQPEAMPENLFQRFKWRKEVSLEEAREAIRTKAFINYDDMSYTAGLRQALAERFPNPAPWEIV